MARRKKGNPINGWIVLDKSAGMTSTQAVAAVRRIYDAQKAGHAGTLDPLATGILPIALGEATKTVSYAVDGEKAYCFTVRWGEQTNTDDAEGSVVQTSDRRPTVAEIEALLPRYVGTIMQTPPKFSAIKVEGNRAYDLAREGEPVELMPREVDIDALRLIDVPDDDTAVFAAECGKGTYVRALARDLGVELGCYGHVIALRRTRVGPFSEVEAVTLKELEDAAVQPATVETEGRAGLAGALKPVQAALRELTMLNVGQADAARIGRGQAILIRGRDAPAMTGDAYAIWRGCPLAIGILERGEFRPVRVFNLAPER
ncbi:MAG: tRNA pseudouridine(55) synthase TruB [Hyphomicrobiaceae bacterium]